MTRARAGAATVAVTATLIALLTLTPALGGDQESRWCIVCGRRVLGDALLNIALFIPLGFGVGLLGVSRRRTLVIALLTTVGIELAQGLLLRGRFASLSDVATNTLGTLAGHALAARWHAFVFPSPRIAARRGAGLLAIWLGILAFSAWALTPPLREGDYRALLPEQSGSPGNAGFVRSAELHRTVEPRAPLADSAAITAARRHRQLFLLTRFDPPLPEDGLVAVVRRDGSTPVITIAHVRGLSIMTVHSPASSFLLYEPTIFSGPVATLPRSRDSLVAIAGGIDGALIRMLFLRDSAVVMEARFDIAPALWPYLLVGHGPAPGFLVPFSALLNALLLAPAAFWLGSGAMTARGGRRRWAATAMAILVSALALGFGTMPAISRLVPTPVEVWIASSAAVLLGWGMAAVAMRYAWYEYPPRIPS